ncbi:MAG: response regulator [Burkholderiales bacterium]|nr:response regulator [Burkholderiales bacterium]
MVVREKDVYALTGKGSREISGAETSLSRAALDLLVRIDGKLTVAQIATGMQSMDLTGVMEAFRALIRDGLVDLVPDRKKSDEGFGDFFDAITMPPSRKALSDADGDAAAAISSLKAQRYFVRIARRGPERKTEDRPALSAVVIEDETHLAKFLKQYLSLEGIDARIAANRAEIVTELRRLPPPDLVLLDVMLPDADGFDVLLRIRQHPALRTVPVIMLTAKATREAVLQGLACGANGYITKPFEADVLIKAVKAVLGLRK